LAQEKNIDESSKLLFCIDNKQRKKIEYHYFGIFEQSKTDDGTRPSDEWKTEKYIYD
jgi:hypothetical protein